MFGTQQMFGGQQMRPQQYYYGYGGQYYPAQTDMMTSMMPMIMMIIMMVMMMSMLKPLMKSV